MLLGLAGDQIHQRRLAGAVGAEQHAQFALIDDHRYAVDGFEAGEIDRQAVDGERRRHRRVAIPPAALSTAAAAGFAAGVEAGDKPIDEVVGEPGEAARQIQHHQHEYQADDRFPGFGEAFGLADRGGDDVDQDGADAGTEDRGAAADAPPTPPW